MIDGVIVTQLKQILDERGKIMHMMRTGDPGFLEFGEIYFSGVYPGAIKAWHIHKTMTLNYAVPVGRIKLVLYDSRQSSPTYRQLEEYFLGPDNYCRVTIPPLVWNGFKGIGDQIALVANCASIPHKSDEIERLPPWDAAIPYDWALKNR